MKKLAFILAVFISTSLLGSNGDDSLFRNLDFIKKNLNNAIHEHLDFNNEIIRGVDESKVNIYFQINSDNKIELKKIDSANPVLRKHLIEHLNGIEVIGSEVLSGQIIKMALVFKD